ncbi:MAG: small subunit ribosomal protein S19e [Candidatus Woesearchaeota archaeon]|nr:small subunit ribosomal protein S19e [Candidatus Woesearchaeota archaeon]
MDIVYSADSEEFIKRCSEELKKFESIKAPEWALYVKTGAGNERPPSNPDWWYIRCASVLRKIYFYGPIGVSKLRRYYGNRKNRGHAPEKFYKSGGSHIRIMLQQLEKEGLIEQVKTGVHKGRVITSKGHVFLRKISKDVEKEKKEKKPKEEKSKTETKEAKSEKKDNKDKAKKDSTKVKKESTSSKKTKKEVKKE